MLSRLLGHLLKGRRAGEDRLAWYHPAIAAAPALLELHSDSFKQGQSIPIAHAGNGVGANRSPGLSWHNVPPGARELVLIVEDADAPLPRPFVHLVATGIQPESPGLPESALNATASAFAFLGCNSFGKVAYAGPRALPGHGPHRYSFQLLALDRTLRFARPPRLREVLARLDGAVLARGRLDGLFERF
jgi:Raf kinase inhibitor-like YbhB/YbcL family protein